MTENELEPRLQRMLTGRAAQIESHLDAVTLRTRADSERHTVLRYAAPLLVAAAIIVVALIPTVFARSGSQPHKQQPGGGSISVSVPVRPSRPTPSPTSAPTPTHTSNPTAPVSGPSGLPTGSTMDVPSIAVPSSSVPDLPNASSASS